MTVEYIVKIETDVTGLGILIYDENRDFTYEDHGSEAKRIRDSYDMEPLSKVYARAEIDDNGLLHLGAEVEEQAW